MDGDKFSAIGHSGMDFWNPVSGEVIDGWINGFALSPTDQVLDVGCGRGELLRRLHQHHRCTCIGVESSARALAAGGSELTREHADATASGELEFRRQKFAADDFAAEQFRGIACIGSTHAVGDLDQCLSVFGNLLQADGWLWLGVGYWQRDPDQPYLDFLQCSREEMRSHDETIRQFEDAGWRVVQHHLTTSSEWSRYEDGYADNIEKYIAAHPDDPERAAMQTRIKNWRSAYLQWGQSTLGFGLYLLQKNAAASPTIKE